MKSNYFFATLFLALVTISSFSQEIEWKHKANLPSKILSGSAISCQDKIYSISGQEDIGTGRTSISKMTLEYNLTTNEWIKKSDIITGRWNLACASVDGKIYAIGGDSFLDKNEMYDPATDTWQTCAPMPTGRQHVKAVVVNNKIYIIGGLESWTKVSTKNEAYDPRTNTWETMAPIPTPKHNYAAVVYKDKIYVFSGNTPKDGDIWSGSSTYDVYDPATNTWATSSSLPTIRINPGVGIINDRVIIVGGFMGDGVVASVDIFNITTGTWSQSTSIPKKIVAMSSTTYNDKIYIIGGSPGPDDWNGYNTVYEGTLLKPTNIIPKVN